MGVYGAIGSSSNKLSVNIMKNTKEIKSFKADNYGEVIAVIKDLELVSYTKDGDYSGDYIAILKDKEKFYYYIGQFGSCSGCDWLEDVQDWNTGEVPYQEALNYVTQDLTPEYITPLNMPLKFKKNDEINGFQLIN